MPFTREIWDYPINRLLLRVGMALQTWLYDHDPVFGPKNRKSLERRIADYLDLDRAVDLGLLRSYHIRWNYDRGKIRTIHLIPHDKVRRTPGIAQIKKLFFRDGVI